MGRVSRRKRERRALGALDRARNSPAGRRTRVNRDRPKISEALAALVRPYTAYDMKVEDFRGLVGVGALAWNLSLLEDGPAANALVDLVDGVEVSDRERFESFVCELVDRKRSLFPKDVRFIAAWDVTVKPDGSFFLTAAGASVE